MSDLGLLPIIQVQPRSQACWSARARQAFSCFSGRTSTAEKWWPRPERRSLSRCSTGSPLVTRMQRWRWARVAMVSAYAGEEFDLLLGDGLR